MAIKTTPEKTLYLFLNQFGREEFIAMIVGGEILERFDMNKTKKPPREMKPRKLLLDNKPCV